MSRSPIGWRILFRISLQRNRPLGRSRLLRSRRAARSIASSRRSQRQRPRPIGAAIDDSLPLVGPALAPTLLAPILQDALSAAKINEALELGTGAPPQTSLPAVAPPQTSLPAASSTSPALHFPSPRTGHLALLTPRTGPLALLTPSPPSSFGAAPIAAGDEKPSPPPIAPPPTAPSPSGSPSGSSGPIFIPLAALTVLVALLAPALLRRLREGPGIPVPTPFVCALERPG